MPWKHIPPEWWAERLDELLLFLSLLWAVGMGMAARVVTEIRDGDREQFFSLRLILEIPTLMMMVIVTLGSSQYFGLGPAATGGIGAMAGYLGPRAATSLLVAVTDRIRGGN